MLAALLLCVALPTSARAAEASCAGLKEPFRQQEEKVRVETGSTRLPDCRAYELVSPPNKNGALLGGLFSRHNPPIVATDGTKVIAPSDQCFSGPKSCVAYRLTEGEPYEFTRTSQGWVTEPLAPPIDEFETDSYWAVDPNTGTALFSAPAYPEGPDDFYGREPDGHFFAIGPLGEPKPGNGTEQANASDITPSGVFATGDLRHVVYETENRLWEFDKSQQSGLYEFAGEENVAPDLVGVQGGEGSHGLVSECSTVLGGLESPTRGEALSENGHVVYFLAAGHANGRCPEKDTAPPITGLYARIDGESPEAHTVLISGPATTGCTTSECIADTTTEADFREPNFEGASSDGSRVFFTDTQQLTNGASESEGNPAGEGCNGNSEAGGCNLYMSICAEPCGSPQEAPDPGARELVDVSEGAKELGGPRVQGVMAVSADGSHVYFVAKGVLTGGEENQEHEVAENESDNLYVYEDKRVHFITRLAASDNQERQWQFQNNMISNVTADGEFFLFTDDRALTADDTRPEGEVAAQVFEYDAGTGSLKRVSVGENGFDDNGNDGTGNAYILPARRGGSNDGIVSGTRSPSLSENGELVFFESPVALVPGALADVSIGEGRLAENIYEYERGQVYLISDGADTTPSPVVAESESRAPTELVGVGVSSADVVFSTFDQLVPEDTDTLRDYYDAHVCSEAEPCIAPKPAPATCSGEGCQGAPGASPAFALPGSTSLVGISGNLTPATGPAPRPKTAAQIRAEKLGKALKQCRKDRQRSKRRACEKAARGRYGPAKAGKTGRRAKG
ncbi:MAG TPA: hypothetical protein VGY13_06755 [Solirubrobacteraceae bacterium]|nr:hypothetical protein [Solirubrobacteraceae bacterium]